MHMQRPGGTWLLSLFTRMDLLPEGEGMLMDLVRRDVATDYRFNQNRNNRQAMNAMDTLNKSCEVQLARLEGKKSRAMKRE